MEETLADILDGDELIDTKVEGVHWTDKDQGPSELCLYCVIWALACWLCGKFLSSERIDAHSLNKVLQTEGK